MPIAFDLTAEQNIPRNGAGTVLGFAELTSAARRPRDLASVLWGDRHDEVILHEDEVPKSAKQAAATLLAGLTRAGTRRVSVNGTERPLSGPGLLAHGASELRRAAPRELRDTIALRRRALSDCEVKSPLDGVIASGRPSSVLYLRGNPALTWKGHAVGGAITHMTGVINGMLDDGAEVTVLGPSTLPGLRAPVREVRIQRVFHFEPWLTMAAYAEELERAAAGTEADVVYQRYEPGSLAGLRVARRLGVPLILEYNGSETWVERNWGTTGKPSRGHELQEKIEQYMLESASLVVVVSDPLREQLVARGIDRETILVNPNGVDVDFLASYRERSPREWRTEAGLEEAPTIGFIGTFGYWHGVLELPDMIAALAKSHPDARWVLIGDGQLWPEVETAIHDRGLTDRVTMTGTLPRDRALATLAATDVCVSPHVPNPDGTPFFGSPTKLFEYMGLGKPIVASDLEQLGEVLSDGVNGLLHVPGDSQEAAAAVGRLLDDPELRERLGAEALGRAKANYTWTVHADRILETIAGDAVTG